MRSLVPAEIPPQPPLSWREVVVLILLLPVWLPIVAAVVAAVVVVGLLFAPDPPTDLEPDADDGLPDDYVPPFVPPRRRPAKALPPPRRIALVPAPASVKSTTATPADDDELDQIPASSWPGRFPGG